jgi:hypothetical protein
LDQPGPIVLRWTKFRNPLPTEELAHETEKDRLAKELFTKTWYRALGDCSRLGALNPAEVLIDCRSAKVVRSRVKRAHFLAAELLPFLPVYLSAKILYSDY